ncbi:hypothetical protein BSL82_10515 [Tardibacter chloracetimidivorans]|uniref:SnoaL-like domain-containing protein n=1 Tax=Tardibacter chloracetimidivorans TaxID=1921510 RepID=A0A1L3ZVP3_9SPHN|nr:nuclear transport factor 2 family protein [Tardibacter chloracetimidivorans]API59698.1 hypothetical protein BSL82_10515 [Tardibacter chloracetimidivorans]
MNHIEENKSVVCRFMDAFSAGDLKTIFSLWHEDLDYWICGHWPMAGHRNKEESIDMVSGVGAALKEIKSSIVSMTAEEDRVVVELVASGHWMGKDYYNTVSTTFVIKNGKILKMRVRTAEQYSTTVAAG